MEELQALQKEDTMLDSSGFFSHEPESLGRVIRVVRRTQVALSPTPALFIRHFGGWQGRRDCAASKRYRKKCCYG